MSMVKPLHYRPILPKDKRQYRVWRWVPLSAPLADPAFVDGSLEPLGATITRSDVDYEYTKRSAEEIDDLDDEISTARAKLKAATDKEKAGTGLSRERPG